MGLRLRSRLGNFGKISRDFGKYSSRPGFSVYNLGKITEIWSRLIFFVYCSLNLNTVIVLLPRKQREKRTRSRISRSRRDLQWTEMDMSVPSVRLPKVKVVKTPVFIPYTRESKLRKNLQQTLVDSWAPATHWPRV